MINLLLNLIFNLCDNGGVIDNKQSENNTTTNTPINAETTDIFFNNGGGILIAVFLIILAALIGLSIFYILKYKELKSEIKNYKTPNQKQEAEEDQILSQYRKLSEQEKKLINDTLATLNNNHKDN